MCPKSADEMADCVHSDQTAPLAPMDGCTCAFAEFMEDEKCHNLMIWLISIFVFIASLRLGELSFPVNKKNKGKHKKMEKNTPTVSSSFILQ